LCFVIINIAKLKFVAQAHLRVSKVCGKLADSNRYWPPTKSSFEQNYLILIIDTISCLFMIFAETIKAKPRCFETADVSIPFIFFLACWFRACFSHNARRSSFWLFFLGVFFLILLDSIFFFFFFLYKHVLYFIQYCAGLLWYRCPTFVPMFGGDSACGEMSVFPFFVILLAGYRPSYLHDLFMLVFWFWLVLRCFGSCKYCKFYPAGLPQRYTLEFSFLLFLVAVWWWLFPLQFQWCMSLQVSHKFFILLLKLMYLFLWIWSF